MLNKKGDNKKGDGKKGGGGGGGKKQQQRRASKALASSGLGPGGSGFISMEIHGMVLGKVHPPTLSFALPYIHTVPSD